jgi:hypothetical protein
VQTESVAVVHVRLEMQWGTSVQAVQVSGV